MLLMCSSGICSPLFQASRIMQKLINPDTEQDVSKPQDEVTSPLEDKSNSELSSSFTLVDYSNLLGEEFQMPYEQCDCSYLNILDIGAVEEGTLHVLYSCASQVPFNNMIYNSLVSIILSKFAVCTLFNTLQFTACSLQQVGREIFRFLGCTATCTSSAARLSVTNKLCLVLVID